MKKRVVITGLGAVTPLGLNVESFWNALRAGRCGVGPITVFNPERVACRVAAQINDFNPEDYFDHRTVQRTARFTQFAMVAAAEARRNARFDGPWDDPKRVGVILGNGIGGLEIDSEAHRKLYDKGPSRIGAMMIPKMIANEAAGNVAMLFGIHGPAHTIITACAGGTDAMGCALETIRNGRADIILAGGTEATIVEFGVGGFCALKALSTGYNETPEKASRPFDKNRDGFVMGEGAGILVFESLDHALKRGAPILAEVAGWGATCDAYHITAPAPDGEGAAEAMRIALDDAALTPADIDYINAHGTATPTNDPIETKAIKAAFGADAYRVKISSIKGAIGHCLGAAGGIEGVVCAKALSDGFCPPTLHLDEPDPECDLDYVPNVGVSADLRAVMSISLGFGGHNSAIVFKKYA